jgi:hypothetical protein
MLSKLAFLADMPSVYHCCRVAIEQQASLVPVLALGETLQLRNLYDMPALQQYTYKRLGFPGASPQRKCIKTCFHYFSKKDNFCTSQQRMIELPWSVSAEKIHANMVA